MNPGSNPRARRGCWFYGLLSVGVAGFLLLLLVVVGFYAAKKVTQRWIQDYTDTAPALVEKVRYPPAQLEALRQRLAAFRDALDKGKATEELVLSAEDLNALIAEDRDLGGKLFVRIDESRLQGDVSMPLSDIGPLKLKGRYLNGTATFRVGLEQGQGEVFVETMLVKSKPLPRTLLRELKKQNLVLLFGGDPDTTAFLAKFESVQVTNSQVVLRIKSGTR